MQTRGTTAHYRRAHDGDSALVSAAQGGDEAALLALVSRYRGFVRVKARGYFLAGAERDDVVQEGMIGLCKAIRDYRSDRQSSFRTFAELCVTRQLITAIKTASRQKHAPLNTYVSLQRSVGTPDEGDRVLSDVLAARDVGDPAEIVIDAWEAAGIQRGFAEALSSFEGDVLAHHLAGRSYGEIAELLGRHAKAVDNALQRIKRKVELQVRRSRAC